MFPISCSLPRRDVTPTFVSDPPFCDTPESDRIVGVSPEESAAITCKVGRVVVLSLVIPNPFLYPRYSVKIKG